MINNNYNQWTTPVIAKPRRSYIWPLTVAAIGLALAIAALIYSGGFEAISKLLGVGAGGTQEVVLTSVGDLLGTSGKSYINGGANMQSTGAFTAFPGLPADPDSTDEGLGFVTAIFNNSADSEPVAGPTAPEYFSPILDLGIAAPMLESAAAVDFVAEGTQVGYSYRFAAELAGLADREFSPLELNIVNSNENINRKNAVINQLIARYVQIKLVFGGNLSSENRPAVYSISLQYSNDSEVAEGGGPGNGGGSQGSEAGSTMSQRSIAVQYSQVNAPMSASVSIVSADLNDPVAYLAGGVNLAERNSLSFDAGLAPGAYAFVISAPRIKDRIIPFLVDNQPNVVINAGSFEVGNSTGMSADLNGDGVINNVDMLILFSQYQSQS